MGSTVVAKDQLRHFSHVHPLNLIHLQPSNYKIEDDDDEDEDEDEDEDDFVEEDHHGGKCNLCNEQILSFHLSYYYCTSCDYALHKFCAELPLTLQGHPLHFGHKLTLSMLYPYKSFHYLNTYREWKCSFCNLRWKYTYNYYCSLCEVAMDIICVTMSQQKINHPSHPHQLERIFGPTVSRCVACGNKHEGVFFQCTTCPRFRLNLDCALLPFKLQIQNHTYGSFTHSHPLTLAYSFPFSEMKARFYPNCRVCDHEFYVHLWLYKCDKCQYYVHVDCATSKREPFMSIFLHKSRGKTSKNFKDDKHPNLLHCPFHDEGDNLLKRYMCDQDAFIGKQNDGEMLNNFIHQHPLILVDNQTSVRKKLVSLHDPVKKVRLLCDGCVRPILTVPFYMCYQCVDEQCCFVLHEWCAKLPLEVQNYTCHPQHTLYLLPKIPGKFFGVFECATCYLASNCFAYGCTMCEYYIDINCAFIPKEITHDAHPDHLLIKEKFSTRLWKRYCNACKYSMKAKLGFHCPSCDFYIHAKCALFLPKVIKNKCDKHPLSLRYDPAENHISEYFCDVCEDKFFAWKWFYHCTKCDQSMHAACAPLILQGEGALATYNDYDNEYDTCIYKYLNIKFGGTLEIKGHEHRLSFVQGLESDDICDICLLSLQYHMTFSCLECEFVVHYECASSVDL